MERGDLEEEHFIGCYERLLDCQGKGLRNNETKVNYIVSLKSFAIFHRISKEFSIWTSMRYTFEGKLYNIIPTFIRWNFCKQTLIHLMAAWKVFQ